MSKARWRKARWVGLAVYCCVALLAATSCGGDDGEEAGGGTTTTEATEGMMTSIGEAEGQLNLINWAGYVEKDWVTPFEQETGCKVSSKVGATSDEMVTLMKTGNYDGVSASGDATLRLIAGGDVAPVNLDLIENYDAVFEGLKNQPHNTVDDVPYGVPHGRGANLLMWRTDVVKPAPDSWGVVFDANSPYKGKITAYDSPIYIADAALYLKATQPDLEIEDPYELDDKQFEAAVDLLKQQNANIGEYWSDAAKQIQSVTNKDTVVGTTWQYQVNQLTGAKDPVPVEATLPKEGSTGWSDTWMISSQAKNPNCMYLWMNYIISPEANAKATEYFGEAPVNAEACKLTQDKNHCTTFHAEDEDYFSKVSYWKTPIKDCGDDRGEVCKDYSEWTAAWTEIKG
ncbi:MAG TPA: ABC transporter substrate-binding protein [Gaiellaceae bacterium]|nr:ABC transporter substrate-binding protein [Gaiellaceae bacterium]